MKIKDLASSYRNEEILAAAGLCLAVAQGKCSGVLDTIVIVNRVQGLAFQALRESNPDAMIDGGALDYSKAAKLLIDAIGWE